MSAPANGSVEEYGVFCGPINQQTLSAISHHLLRATQRDVEHVHLLFQSSGGTVGDCVCLHNLFRAMPIGLTLYNAGAIQSGAVTAYLGARQRQTSAYAQFMIHRAHCSGQFANVGSLESTLDGMRMDDARTEAILRAHTTLPEAIWCKLKERDIFFSGVEAVEYGFADRIAEFSPPAGQSVYFV